MADRPSRERLPWLAGFAAGHTAADWPRRLAEANQALDELDAQQATIDRQALEISTLRGNVERADKVHRSLLAEWATDKATIDRLTAERDEARRIASEHIAAAADAASKQVTNKALEAEVVRLRAERDAWERHARAWIDCYENGGPTPVFADFHMAAGSDGGQ